MNERGKSTERQSIILDLPSCCKIFYQSGHFSTMKLIKLVQKDNLKSLLKKLVLGLAATNFKALINFEVNTRTSVQVLLSLLAISNFISTISKEAEF